LATVQHINAVESQADFLIDDAFEPVEWLKEKINIRSKSTSNIIYRIATPETIVAPSNKRIKTINHNSPHHISTHLLQLQSLGVPPYSYCPLFRVHCHLQKDWYVNCHATTSQIRSPGY